MQNNIWRFFIILMLGVISCDSSQVFDEYKTIENTWHKDAVVSFNFDSTDTIKPYNLFVNIRNTSKFKYSNLFLVVDINFPNGKTLKDTLEYLMAKPSGEFLGTGFTNVKANKLWFKEGFIFSESGDYVINIQQAMRKNGSVKGVENLEGITDVGFRVEKTLSKN